MAITNELCRKLSHAVYKNYESTIEAASLGFVKVPVSNLTVNNESSSEYLYFITTTGLAAAFYYNEVTNEGVIAYRGTENLASKDYIADIEMMGGVLPKQYYDAMTFYNAVMKEYADKRIAITGHSLGGALATLVSLKGGSHQTYTFNAPGVKQLLSNLGLPENGNYNAITNYSVMNDWCGMLNAHIGKLFVFPPVVMKAAPLQSLYDTHNWIVEDNNTHLSKAIVKPVGFNEQEALALWYYDKNNIRSSIGLSAVIAKLAAKTNASALERAISILRNNPQLIQHEFRYKTFNKAYILGFSDKRNDIIGSKENEIIYGGNKTDSTTGGAGNDELHGFEGDDTLKGGSGNDTIYAGEGNNTIYGDAGNDVLFAESGDNKLYGGSGYDNLHDGPGKNLLSGGTGYDIYHTGRYSGGATISDSDGNGIINYDGIFLGRADRLPNEEYRWMDKFGNIFEYVSSNLVINGNVTVKSFKNGDLAISLYKENGEHEPLIPDGSNPSEGEGEGESGEGSGSGSGSGGNTPGKGTGTGESNFDHDDEGNLINDENPEEGENIPPIGEQIGPKPGGDVGEVPPAAGPPNTPPVDPLIFDLDFNNIISLSKPENGRNFDIDNDGIAQKVAWIDSGDAILVCDRNGNGTIDNGLELFGFA